MTRAREGCLQQIQVEPSLKSEILRLSGKGVDVRVLSDANTFFIDTILKSNGLESIRAVVSNPAAFDENGCLRIRPYHTDPHPVQSTSPPNLCKGGHSYDPQPRVSTHLRSVLANPLREVAQLRIV